MKKYQNLNNLTMEEVINVVDDLAESLGVTDEDAIHEGYVVAIESVNCSYHVVYGRVKLTILKYFDEYEKFYTVQQTKIDDCYEPYEGVIDRIYCDEIFNYMDAKRADIVKLHFGFYGANYTCEEIAKMCKLTRARVRNICNEEIKHIQRLNISRYI